jgi:hypothetical protein
MEREVVSGRCILVGVSDIHAGSTIAPLAPEGVELDDGGTYFPSEAQRWLWDKWVELWATLERRLIELGIDEWHLILNGDLVDGDHHNTTQIVSRHPGTQIDIAKSMLEIPLALRPASVVVVRGTEVHVGPSGSAENSIANWIAGQGFNVIADPLTGKNSHWHFKGEYHGVRVDAAHHGKMGQRTWTKANAALMQAAEITLEHAMTNDEIPHLALRSHFHQWAESGTNYPVRVVQLPGYQLATAFVHRIAPGKLADIGGAFFLLEDGKVKGMEPVVFKPKRAETIRVA